MTNILSEDDRELYKVVVNDEKQYSIWSQYRKIPLGWNEEGFIGIHKSCMEYIETVWTDMTPESLREYHSIIT